MRIAIHGVRINTSMSSVIDKLKSDHTPNFLVEEYLQCNDVKNLQDCSIIIFFSTDKTHGNSHLNGELSHFHMFIQHFRQNTFDDFCVCKLNCVTLWSQVPLVRYT